jgi:hypothetical protein
MVKAKAKRISFASALSVAAILKSTINGDQMLKLTVAAVCWLFVSGDF